MTFTAINHGLKQHFPPIIKILLVNWPDFCFVIVESRDLL